MPDPEAPPVELVLPLVVRLERADPPTRSDALEGAARAVLVLLTAGFWKDDVRGWDGQRIRKVVRRARGAEWRRALEVDGIDVTCRTAQLRVYRPVPVDAWPPQLARLQVGGTNLDDPVPPEPVADGDPVILLSPHATMSTGKAMAQAGHAAQLGWRASAPDDRALWRSANFPAPVRDATPAQWAAAVEGGFPVVHDGGFTEVEPGTATAVAVLPWLG